MSIGCPLLIFLIYSSYSYSSLCSKYDACGGRLTRFGMEEGSGYDPGSGQAPPLYDDLVPMPQFDYEQTLDTYEYSFCECEGNSTCSFEQSDNIIVLDNMITLSFCAPISEREVCRSNRNRIRVMGEVDNEHPDIPLSISSAILFCQCPLGYKRQSVEPWQSPNLVFPYTCK